MKKILALAAVAALAAGASAYAANPFSDVSTSDWAYQAVSDLSDQGIVEGYPDGTFKGQTNITRYEMAQIIARLMAKEDQYNAEQRATIDKLAGEYADELDSLGVRVSNLEKKVGNLSFSGNARMRWNQSYDNGKAADNYNGRIKLIARGQVNDSTYVEGRFVSNMDFKDGSSADTSMDELIVHHQFGDKVGLTLGRLDYFAGQTGLTYDDELDGALVSVGSDKLALDVGYGRMYAWQNTFATYDEKTDTFIDKDNPEVTLARIRGTTSRLAYDVEYYNIAKSNYTDDSMSIWGAGLTANVTDQIDVFGDYYKNTDAEGDPQVWTAGLAYGHAAWTKPGTFRIGVQYVDAESGAYLGGSTYHLTPMDAFGDMDASGNCVNEVKYWLASADVILAKNVKLHGEYAFDVDTNTNGDYDDLATLSLNYVF